MLGSGAGFERMAGWGRRSLGFCPEESQSSIPVPLGAALWFSLQLSWIPPKSEGRLGVPSPGPAACSRQDTGHPASSVPRQTARRTAGGFLPVSVDIVGVTAGQEILRF